ncbi:hypothetical protein D3C78_1009860 [compost metagenome]
MLGGAKNQGLYREYYEVIQSSEAKQAYNYLIGWAASLNSHDCFPSSHGVIKDFRFMRGNDWDFAFIPNQQWLLFYFRNPCLNSEKFSKARVTESFPNATENNAGELTIRISTLEMAARFAEYIES